VFKLFIYQISLMKYAIGGQGELDWQAGLSGAARLSFLR
jgi:hypothetical protein